MKAAPRRRRFYHSLRFKLFLVSLTLLVIPWAGYRYIQETESFLRQAQETMLLGTAQAVAAILHDREEVFSPAASEAAGDTDERIYVQPMDGNVILDGYLEEWSPYLQNLRPLPESGTPQLEYLAAEDRYYLYLVLRVHDGQIVYQRPGERRVDLSDRLLLTLDRPDGKAVHYVITTTGPGWVTAEQLPDGPPRQYPSASESRIQGEWQEMTGGFTLELRIPRYLFGDSLAFGFADVDDPLDPETLAEVSTGRLAPLLRPNPEIARIIGGLEHETARIWVLDRNRLVLARRGGLGRIAEEAEDPADGAGFDLSRLLFSLVLKTPSDTFTDPFSGYSRLQGGEILASLGGKPETRRRPTPDGRAVILSAAWPIRSSRGILGAVLVEQSTNRILSLQNAALERLFSITFLLFVATGLALIGFASLLTGRIGRLRNRVERAVSPDGRIQGTLAPARSADEIGDLGRSFSSVLDRLAEYNRYLEQMASRLAHELRTPLTVVKSSLENLEAESDPDARQRYVGRAREGAERLGLILHRMREATRLEQSMQQMEPEPFDPDRMLRMAAENYSTAFPDVRIRAETPGKPLQLLGAPDLISQALDKLVGNAIDFHTPGTPILLRLESRPAELEIQVINRGTLLPEGRTADLFASMVSLRERRTGESHLGLGLYLVRLISEFHRGSAGARNLEDGSGVLFFIRLPKVTP